MTAEPHDFIVLHMKKCEMFKTLEQWMGIYNEFKNDSYSYLFFMNDLWEYLQNPTQITKILIRIYVDRMGEMDEKEALAKHIITRMLEDRGAFKYEHRRNP